MPAATLDRAGQVDLVLALMYLGAVEARLEREGLTDAACRAMIDASDHFASTCHDLGLDPMDPEHGALIIAAARKALA